MIHCCYFHVMGVEIKSCKDFIPLLQDSVKKWRETLRTVVRFTFLGLSGSGLWRIRRGWEFYFHVYYDNSVLTGALTFYFGSSLPSLGSTSVVPTRCFGDIPKQMTIMSMGAAPHPKNLTVPHAWLWGTGRAESSPTSSPASAASS